MGELVPYVPRLLLEQPGRDVPSHWRVDGTLVLADVSGFTQLSERLADAGKLGAEEMVGAVTRVFTALLDAVGPRADVLQFSGDALLLLFCGGEHAQRACSAALAMRRTLSSAGRISTSRGPVTLRMSIGASSGAIHCFLVGRRHHVLVVAGETASEAVRLEAAAGAGEIVVSDSTTAGLAPSAVEEGPADAWLLRRAPAATITTERGATPGGGRNIDVSRFLAPRLRDRLGLSPPEHEHRQATVAFLAFRGTDQLLAATGPDGALQAVHALVTAVEDAAEEHGVSLIACDVADGGGKLMLAAGTPTATEDDEARMLHTLRAVLDRPYTLSVRAGVTRGHVFGGDVGAPSRRTYSVMGDSVNLAARLSGRAAWGEALVETAVLERAGTFEARVVEPFRVKGKTAPVHAGVLGRPRRHDPPAVAQTALVGRDDELRRLLDAVAQAERGTGSVTEVVADAGMGKTRLIEELRTRAGVEQHAVRCEPYDATAPYGAARALLRSVLAIPADASGDRAGTALTDVVARVAPDLTPWLPLLALAVGAEVPMTVEVAHLADRFRQDRLHRASAALLARAVARPALFVVEDADWMDEASATLLARVFEGARTRAWACVVTSRPEVRGLRAEVGYRADTLALAPLPEEAAERLLADAPHAPPDPGERRLLAARAGGNPFFLLELAAARDDAGGLPDSVEAVVATRLDRLPPPARRLLRCAGVLGSTFPRWLLEQLLVASELVADDRAWAAAGAFLVSEREGWLRFRHDLFRQTAYESLSYRDRRSLHARAGGVLEAHGADEPEALSLHFHAAAAWEKAWDYSVLAGDRARLAFANSGAASFYRRALDAAPHLLAVSDSDVSRVNEDLGDVLELAGRYDEADRAYDAARKLAVDPGDVTRLLRKQGVLRERQGRYRAALQWYARGLKTADTVRNPRKAASLRATLEIAYAGVRYRQGKLVDVAEWAQRAATDAKQVDDRATLAHAYYLLDAAYTDLGDTRSARYRELALPIYEELGDLLGQANVLNNLGINAYYEGDWDEALRLYEQSRDARLRAGDVVGAATAANNIGEILADQGRLDEAEELFRDALRTWQWAAYPLGVALATSNLGRTAARQGRYEEGERLLEDARDAFTAIEAEGFVVETAARVAELALLRGDAHRAVELSEQALAAASTTGAPTAVHVLLQRVAGRALVAVGDRESGCRRLRESLALARQLGVDFEVAMTLLALARGCTGAGADADAEQDAVTILKRLGVADVAALPL